MPDVGTDNKNGWYVLYREIRLSSPLQETREWVWPWPVLCAAIAASLSFPRR